MATSTPHLLEGIIPAMLHNLLILNINPEIIMPATVKVDFKVGTSTGNGHHWLFFGASLLEYHGVNHTLFLAENMDQTIIVVLVIWLFAKSRNRRNTNTFLGIGFPEFGNALSSNRRGVNQFRRRRRGGGGGGEELTTDIHKVLESVWLSHDIMHLIQRRILARQQILLTNKNRLVGVIFVNYNTNIHKLSALQFKHQSMFFTHPCIHIIIPKTTFEMSTDTTKTLERGS